MRRLDIQQAEEAYRLGVVEHGLLGGALVKGPALPGTNDLPLLC